MISRTAKSSFVKYLSATTGLSIIAMMAPVMASAQTTPTAAPKADDTVIVVTGVRGSQQSAIDRKKRAKTATDSITSEDVGSFPDKNIGEAISRIAGVALGRNDFGEGQDVTVRGATAEQTHVEIDGMSQLSTAGGISSGAGTSTAARGADFRELPSDLVKSVDIVKGSLPSMTEGSLGGSIKIVTRTGLDCPSSKILGQFGSQNSGEFGLRLG
jgi:TonB-dependent receptor